MLRKISLLLALFMIILTIVSAQQTINPTVPMEADLITPVNIKPLTIDDMERKRGVSDENPARNVIILFGSGFVEETASILRSSVIRKLEINEMESMQLVLPTICSSQEKPQIDLISFLTGNGRVAGIVSDTEFSCSSACDFLRMKSSELFDRVKMALSLADFDNEDQRAAMVKAFSGKIIEFAANRKDLDRLFTNKAEKIVGCFKRNPIGSVDQRDISQPYFDELVTASLSRLSVEEHGFLLLVGAKAATKARDEGRFADMIEHLKIQEKVLHQINYFVSGRKDTLVIIVEDSNSGYYKFGNEFKLKESTAMASELNQVAREMIVSPDSVKKMQEKYSYFSKIDENLLNELIAQKNARLLAEALQKALADYFTISFVRTEKKPGQSGFILFSRGVGADLMSGLVSYEDFIRRLSVITGIKTEN